MGEQPHDDFLPSRETIKECPAGGSKTVGALIVQLLEDVDCEIFDGRGKLSNEF